MNKRVIGIISAFVVIASALSAAGIMNVENDFKKIYDDDYWCIHVVKKDHDSDIPNIILDDDYYQDAPRDRVEFNSVELIGDILELSVSYSGGCVEHDFALVGPTTFMESEPVQTAIVLSHDDHDDPCDAWLSENLSYNLSPLKELWQEYYQQDSGTIIIWLEEYEEAITYDF